MFDMYGRMTESGGKLNMPDETTFDRAQKMMAESEKALDTEERRVIAEIFRDIITGASQGLALTRGPTNDEDDDLRQTNQIRPHTSVGLWSSVCMLD